MYVGGEVLEAFQNPNPEVEGYSYVNLVLVKNLGAGQEPVPQTRRVDDFF